MLSGGEVGLSGEVMLTGGEVALTDGANGLNKLIQSSISLSAVHCLQPLIILLLLCPVIPSPESGD